MSTIYNQSCINIDLLSLYQQKPQLKTISLCQQPGLLNFYISILPPYIFNLNQEYLEQHGKIIHDALLILNKCFEDFKRICLEGDKLNFSVFCRFRYPGIACSVYRIFTAHRLSPKTKHTGVDQLVFSLAYNIRQNTRYTIPVTEDLTDRTLLLFSGLQALIENCLTHFQEGTFHCWCCEKAETSPVFDFPSLVEDFPSEPESVKIAPFLSEEQPFD